MQFMKKELEQKSYIATEALSIIKKVEFIDKKRFMAVALDKNIETFIVYVAILFTALIIQVYSTRQVQVSLLFANKSPVEDLPKCLDYTDIFLFDFTMELPENIYINKHVIKLEEDKQVPYEPIYSLG